MDCCHKVTLVFSYSPSNILYHFKIIDLISNYRTVLIFPRSYDQISVDV